MTKDNNWNFTGCGFAYHARVAVRRLRRSSARNLMKEHKKRLTFIYCHRIQYLPCLQNLLKSQNAPLCWFGYEILGFIFISRLTVKLWIENNDSHILGPIFINVDWNFFLFNLCGWVKLLFCSGCLYFLKFKLRADQHWGRTASSWKWIVKPIMITHKSLNHLDISVLRKLSPNTHIRCPHTDGRIATSVIRHIRGFPSRHKQSLVVECWNGAIGRCALNRRFSVGGEVGRKPHCKGEWGCCSPWQHKVHCVRQRHFHTFRPCQGYIEGLVLYREGAVIHPKVLIMGNECRAAGCFIASCLGHGLKMNSSFECCVCLFSRGVFYRVTCAVYVCFQGFCVLKLVDTESKMVRILVN